MHWLQKTQSLYKFPFWKNLEKLHTKSRIRETLNILTDVDRSTDIIFFPVIFFGGGIQRNMLGVGVQIIIIIFLSVNFFLRMFRKNGVWSNFVSL